MGRTCSAYAGEEDEYRVLVGTSGKETSWKEEQMEG